MRAAGEALDVIERALAAVRGLEADAVFLERDLTVSRFANSNIHQNMADESASLTLRVAIEGRVGVATTSTFDVDELERTAVLARDAARHADIAAGFPGLYRGGEELPAVEPFDEASAGIRPEETARTLAEMFETGKTRGVELAGACAIAVSYVACGNSHGVRRHSLFTSTDANVIAFRGKHSGFAAASGRRAAGVDITALGAEATEKALLLTDHPVSIEQGQYDVVLEPAAVTEVLEWLNLIAFSGQAFDDQSSFLAGRIGERVLHDSVTIADDALDPSFLPFPFDLEGLPKRRVSMIERGVVRTPTVDTLYAARLGIPATANCWGLGASEHGTSFHTSMAGGSSTREELIRATKRGIWVTRFNYVNGLLEPKTALMTGTTRDGTFLIRDGEVVGRLPNLRWTQSIVEAFSNIDGLTRERRIFSSWFNAFGGMVAPTVRIRDWTFTGVQGS